MNTTPTQVHIDICYICKQEAEGSWEGEYDNSIFVCSSCLEKEIENTSRYPEPTLDDLGFNGREYCRHCMRGLDKKSATVALLNNKWEIVGKTCKKNNNL